MKGASAPPHSVASVASARRAAVGLRVGVVGVDGCWLGMVSVACSSDITHHSSHIKTQTLHTTRHGICTTCKR